MDRPSGISPWARENQTEFYKIYARLINAQREIAGADSDSIETRYAGYSDAELDKLILQKVLALGIAVEPR